MRHPASMSYKVGNMANILLIPVQLADCLSASLRAPSYDAAFVVKDHTFQAFPHSTLRAVPLLHKVYYIVMFTLEIIQLNIITQTMCMLTL